MKMMKRTIIKILYYYFRKINQLKNNLNINFLDLKGNHLIIYEYDKKRN